LKFCKRSLISTPGSCADLVTQLAEVGVDECAACSTSASPDVILEHLPYLARLKDRFAPRP
jgi:hypothetical protein